MTLSGQVVGGQGQCSICAEGAVNPVMTDANGIFEITGVPSTARWIRAVCDQASTPFQGDVALDISSGVTSTIAITVTAQGQGWTQAALSRDNCLVAGVHYDWHLDDQGARVVNTQGMIYDVNGNQIATLTLPDGDSISGVAWSPVADELIGTLSSETAATLWLSGCPGQLDWVTAADHQSSGRDAHTECTRCLSRWHLVVFALQHRSWWSDTQYKTDIVLYIRSTQEYKTLVSADWGTHYTHPTWGPGGMRIYFTTTTGQPGDDPATLTNGQIWWTTSDGAAPVLVTDQDSNALPAARRMLNPQ